MRLLPCLIAMVLALLAAAPVPAQPAPVLLQPGQGVPDLGQRMVFAPDTGAPVEAVVEAFRRGELDPDFTAVADGIAPYQPVWGVVAVRLARADGDAEALGPSAEVGRRDYRLVPQIYGLVGLDAWVVRDGAPPVPLIAHSIRRAVDEADYSGTRLAARPFALAPGETATVAVRLVFGPLQGHDIALETAAEHVGATYEAGVAHALYYALLAACILFFFVFNLSLSNRVGLGYSALLGLGLLFVAYLDGLAFRFLYPTLPGWHLPLGIGLLMGIAATGFRLAAATVAELDGSAWLGRLARLGALLAIAGIVAALVAPPEITAPLSYLLTVAMIGAQALAAFSWRGAVGRYVLVNRGLGLLAFAATALLLAMLFAGWGTEGLPAGWLVKGIYAAIALLIMAGLSMSLLDLRDAHEAALRRELAAVQKEAETSRNLLEAERNYTRARDLADLRRQQLATASHDIRQPLMSLRLTLDAIAREQDPGLRARLGQAFDYMEDLAHAYLAESRPDEAGEETEQTGEAPQTARPAAEPADPYALSLIIDTAGQMFGQEAAAKALDLRLVPSSVETTVPAMALLRITGNLVSNAVKYTREGRVLVGVRRRAERTEILVADTGPGLTPEELERVSAAWQKGTHSTGEGLGLAICHGLAAEHGLDLLVTSTPGRGTCFRLVVPRVRVAGRARAAE